jgi:hypothetical protein
MPCFENGIEVAEITVLTRFRWGGRYFLCYYGVVGTTTTR